MSWAQRLKRVFKLDLESCEGCGGQLRVIAGLEDPVVIAKILAPLDRPVPWAVTPVLRPPVRGILGRSGALYGLYSCEGFFGMLKRERVHHRRYRTRDEARADLFDYLERYHNPRMRRKVARRDREFSALTQPSVEMG